MSSRENARFLILFAWLFSRSKPIYYSITSEACKYFVQLSNFETDFFSSVSYVSIGLIASIFLTSTLSCIEPTDGCYSFLQEDGFSSRKSISSSKRSSSGFFCFIVLESTFVTTLTYEDSLLLFFVVYLTILFRIPSLWLIECAILQRTSEQIKSRRILQSSSSSSPCYVYLTMYHTVYSSTASRQLWFLANERTWSAFLSHPTIRHAFRTNSSSLRA